MSRIGRKPVVIPAAVKVTHADDQLKVKGPKGELAMTLRPEVGVEVEDGVLRVQSRAKSVRDASARAYHGMTRALVQNMVVGVTDGYAKKLEINGVGYNAKIEGADLVLTLGFSHPVRRKVPTGLNVTCPSQTTIVVEGCDKQMVGEFAANVRRLRPPEPYKGKGIKYDDEIIRRKAGKAFGNA